MKIVKFLATGAFWMITLTLVELLFVYPAIVHPECNKRGCTPMEIAADWDRFADKLHQMAQDIRDGKI
jgi:hypothetical protein